MSCHPLTQSQLGMYLDWNADRASIQYNIALDNAFPSGSVDPKRLAAAVRKVFETYPVFRMRFAERDGEVVQYPEAAFDFAVDVRAATEDEMPSIRAAFMRPFDPFAEPMVRAAVVTTEKATHLLTDFLHLVMDGTCFRRFDAALAAAYAGREMPSEAMPFADYAALEPALFEQDAYRVAKAEHAARFAGKAMTVPEGDGRSDARPFVRAVAQLPRAAVEAFCRAHEVHPNLFFMGAFARTLALYANTTEAVFYTVNHGRRDPRLKETFGAFVKSVPVLAELPGDKTLAEVLQGLKLHRVGDYPFTHFCRDLGLKPGFGYVFQDGTVDLSLHLDTAASTSLFFSPGGVGRLPTLQVGGNAEEFTLDISLLPGAYSEPWCAAFANRVAEVARQFLAHPDARLADIPVVSDAEAAELVALSRGRDLPYDADATFVDLFRRQAQARPSATAVVAANGTLTYAELGAESDALAAALVEKGVKPGAFVAVKLGRVKEFAVAAIGIMKAGAGYVPIDPDYPAERIAYMVEDCGAKVVIDEAFLVDAASSPRQDFVDAASSPRQNKEESSSGGRGEEAASTGARLATPASPAYMIYTSGSTGRPKGVVLPHRALVAFCAWVVDELKLDADSRMGVTASFSFDASVFDLFPALTVGGAVHIFSEELRKDLAGMRAYAEENKMTGWTMSTQLGLAMLNAYPDVPLRTMVLGGEKLVPYAKSAVRVYNGYGPTEFTVCSSFQVVDQAASGEVPIGRPVPNSHSFVCDRFGQLVPRGMVGELCLAGVQIADGYWHQPEKTAKAFASLPWTRLSQSRLVYRTGDYACYDDDGRLLYRGRIDSQVKLRGFRIEIGEIEHAASQFPGIDTVAAEVRDVGGAKHLVLYYVESGSDALGRHSCRPGQEDFAVPNRGGRNAAPTDEDALRDFLAKSLTAYMVPDYYVRLEKMPLTPVGKIDRKALPLPALTDDPVVAPECELETKILAALREVLHADEIGVTHDFNRIGLTSLGAMSLVAKLKRTCGVTVTLSALAKTPTVRALAAAVGGSVTETPQQAAAHGRRPRRATYPMTESQRGVYADWLKNPGTTQYNVPAAFRFPGLDADTLAAAAERVVDAHPALKARFVEKDGEIVQERRDAAKIAVVRETPDAEPAAAFFAAKMRPFKPQGEDLARFAVYEVPAGARRDGDVASTGVSYLFVDAHHTVFDGFSMGVFLQDLLAALDGREIADEDATLFDAGLEDRDYLESELVAEDDAWFAKYLDGCESTSLEASEPPPTGVASGTAARAVAHVPAEALNRRAAELGVSASDWFLTAFMELLRRLGRSDDVQILFVSAGRGNADYAHSVGMFVRTLPVRNVKDETTFSATVKRLHADVLALRDRDRASYARIAERNGLTPEIIFAYEGGLFDLPRGASLISPSMTTAKFPLSVTVTPGRDDFELAFEYDASRYGAHEMELLVGLFAHLAEGAVSEDALRAIPLLDEAAAAEAVKMAYGGDLDYDATRTFVDLFDNSVRTRPFATAVVDAQGEMTYAELGAASDALAAALVEKGVKPGAFVAVKLGRVKEFVVAAIGVMKAGAGYVPIDPDYPAERIAYMVEDCGAKVVIDEAFLVDAASSPRQNFVDAASSPRQNKQDSSSGGRGEDAASTGVRLARPEGPAYMIYTSGSTGRPKGVVLPHRALRHLVEWTRRDREITYQSRIAEHASFSFDASVIDIFPVLAAGGELHLYAEELRKDLPGMRDYIVKHGITGGSMSTQIGMALVDAYPELPLHDIMFGGEKLLPTAKTDMRLLNGYGPTEFCVCSSYQVVDQGAVGDIPIGRAAPGTWSFVVDRYGHLLPQGLAGEIALAGPQIADGYWRQPEKTAKAFVSLPWTRSSQSRLAYRTGDLARYDAEGRLLYLGRLDFQIKLRGFRIEIGEIEHAASQFPGIGAVAAEVRDVGGAKHLVLYYTAEGTVDEAALKAALAATLTAYMVPDYYVRLETMPMTPNGKINRKVLAAPSAAAAAHEYVAPREGAERTIAEAWGRILKIDDYGATDDFFESGGTSMLGIRAVVALQKAGLDVQYGDLFKHKTPRALAAFLAGEGTASQTAESPRTFLSYDYAAIDALLAKTRTDLFEDFRVHSLGDVLLTGATGYLGIHVLRHLLESTSSSVTVLLRPKGKAGPERRLDAQYVYYFGERLPRRFRDRVSYVAGDITDDLGAKLAAVDATTVVNCAALVKHYIADDALDRVNVRGVENLLAWCAAKGARFVQTSTYSVGGLVDAVSPARLDERHLFVGQDSDNDYIRTKFLAERAVLAAVAAGKVRAKVMRLGNLMGREADGEFQMNVGANAFVNSLRSYKAIGAYPLDELAAPLEMSPIDRVAEAVCLLATTPDDMVVFHPYNAYALDMGAVLGALNRRGYAVDFVSRGEFAARVDALRNDPRHADELQGILHYAQRHLDGRKATPVSNGWTTTVLYRLGFRWKPAEDRYLANFFDMLDGLAAFG